MNRIFNSKNLIKKIIVFFLFFGFFSSLVNTVKAQNQKPSELNLFFTDSNHSVKAIYNYYHNIPGFSIEIIPFNTIKQQYLNTIHYKNGQNGTINDSYFSQNIQNLYKEIDGLSNRFDLIYTNIDSNTKSLGIEKNFQNLIVSSYSFKELADPLIEKLKNASTTSSKEKEIYDKLILKIKATSINNFAQIDSNNKTEVIVIIDINKNAPTKKYQFDKNQNKINDLDSLNIDSNFETSIFGTAIKSFNDIISEIIKEVDNKASPNTYKNNKDIVNLKTELEKSKETFNNEIKKINTSVQNSNNVEIDDKTKVAIARTNSLTPVNNLLRNYLNNDNNKKPGNEDVYNAHNAAKDIVEQYLKTASTTITDSGVNYDSTTNTITQDKTVDCDSKSFWDVAFSKSSGCSLPAYLINSFIQMLSGLVGLIVELIGRLFDWIYDKGVIHFNDWVVASDAYRIYKTIILSLIVSVMTFFVFYLIIRRLIDDDGEKMNKILPRLILTALFVYFSFTITGWIIDQSNVITIYLYRSMTHQTAGKTQSIGDGFKNILKLDGQVADKNAGNIGGNYGLSLGSWDAIPYTGGQLIINIVAVFVLIQGAVLILSRTIILLLCMIFSPIMLLPDGLTDITDKYKKVVIDNFTGNVLLGPVFMFLVLIAMEIGQITTKSLVGDGPSLPSTAPSGAAGFLGGIISSVLVIVVLQLAISAAKNLSGSIGEKIGGTIGKFAGKVGGVAAGSAKWAGGKAIGGFMNNTQAGDKINNWISKGASKSGIRGSLLKGVQNYTEKYGLDGETKRNEKVEKHFQNYDKYRNNEKMQTLVKTDLENRARNGDTSAKKALEKINNSIEEKKNSDFKRNKDTRERKVYEEEQKNTNNTNSSSNSTPDKPNSGAAPVVNSGGGNANPPLQGAGAQNIPKDENKTTMKTGESSSTFGRNSLTRQEIATDQNLTDSFKKATSFSERRNLVRQVANKAQTELNAGTYKKREGLINMRQEYKDKFERAETRKEDIEKQNAEIEAEKEKNGGYIPDAKNLDAQQSLKDRLKEKFSTKERMENGKIVKETSPELLEQRKADLKTTQRNIERKREDAYQEKVLEEAQMNANVNAANNNAPSFEETSVNK